MYVAFYIFVEITSQKMTDKFFTTRRAYFYTDLLFQSRSFNFVIKKDFKM